MNRPIRFILVAGLCALAGGCAPKNAAKIQRAVELYYTGNFDPARTIIAPLADVADEDFVLNNCRLGSIDMADGQYAGAEGALLRAYEIINAVGVNEGGRSLGAVLVDEKMKVWKGETYERAMVNYYLGIIYYIAGDYQNARAAFENALFKLVDYGEDPDDDHAAQSESNFIVARLMLAKCWQRLGREDLARANFQAVTRARPDLSALADYDLNAGSNCLLVVDYGYGPRKQTTFDGSIVGFGPLPEQEGSIPSPRIIMDGKFVALGDVARAPVDLLAMAQDRRWQSIDTLRAVKSAIGTGLIVAGAYEGMRGLNEGGSAQRRDLLVGVAMLGAGLLLKATSQADIRQWEMLPRTSFVIPLRLPAGVHDVTIDFPGVAGMGQTLRNLVVPPTGEVTVYVRMMRWGN